MILQDRFRAEFGHLETRAAMGDDGSSALDDLMGEVERAAKAMAFSDWRREVEGILGSLQVGLVGLSTTDERLPLRATAPMQNRKTRLVEAAISRLTDLLEKSSP